MYPNHVANKCILGKCPFADKWQLVIARADRDCRSALWGIICRKVLGSLHAGYLHLMRADGEEFRLILSASLALPPDL